MKGHSNLYGSSNKGGVSSADKGRKAPSEKAVGPRADKFHTNGKGGGGGSMKAGKKGY